jgi:hypothetical protein
VCSDLRSGRVAERPNAQGARNAPRSFHATPRGAIQAAYDVLCNWGHPIELWVSGHAYNRSRRLVSSPARAGFHFLMVVMGVCACHGAVFWQSYQERDSGDTATMEKQVSLFLTVLVMPLLKSTLCFAVRTAHGLCKRLVAGGWLTAYFLRNGRPQSLQLISAFIRLRSIR